MYLYTLPGLPEQVDIGQAIALDFQAVGLKPKLVEIDFPRVRELLPHQDDTWGRFSCAPWP